MIKRNARIVADIEAFKTAHNIEVKCISDRILLYLRWGAQKIGLEDTQSMMDLYYKIRGEAKYSGRNPMSVAAAIMYICAPALTQAIIGQLYHVSDTTIRYLHHEIERDFR